MITTVRHAATDLLKEVEISAAAFVTNASVRLYAALGAGLINHACCSAGSTTQNAYVIKKARCCDMCVIRFAMGANCR